MRRRLGTAAGAGRRPARSGFLLALLALLGLVLASGSWSTPVASGAVPDKQRWLADVREAMSGAEGYVDRRVRRGGRQLAVNLDIDNSSLATYYDRGAPIRVVLRFARHARSKGVDLLFNTGRLSGEGRMGYARRMLTRAGFRVSEICGRRSGEELAASKQRCRRSFVADGYTLIANIGNTRTDFVGGDYERAYRLPDYDGRLG